MGSDETVAMGVVQYLHSMVIYTTSTSRCCCSQAASVVVMLCFCRYKPASAFSAQLVGTFDGPLLITLRGHARLSGLICNPKPGLFCCLHGGCSHEAEGRERIDERQAQTKKWVGA